MEQIKLECCHADTCLPDYWGGHHLPHLSFPVTPGMSLGDIKWALRNELREGAIGGSAPESEFTDEWYAAARAAIDAITPNDPAQTTFFNDIEEPEEDADFSVYAYFVFRPLD